MADLLGYDLDELTQLKAPDVAGRNDRAEIDPIYKRLMKGEQVFGEAVLRRKDGVVGTIKYRAMNGSIGSLPVLVSIRHEISTFSPRK